jgi:CRP-like cAMP-binding protein
MAGEPRSNGVIRVELKRVDLQELLSLDPLIGKATLFNAIGAADTRRLVAAATPRRFGPGQAIYGEGSAGNSLFLVLRGEVALSRQQGGTSVEIAALQKGEFFGEDEALGPSSVRSQSAAASGTTDVAEFSQAHVTSLARKHLELYSLLRETRDARAKAKDELADFLNRW